MSWTYIGLIDVKKGRKRRRCVWCPEIIEIGEPRKGWKGIDSPFFVEVPMHPECFDAYRRCLAVKSFDGYDDELPFEENVQQRGKAIVEPETKQDPPAYVVGQWSEE